VPRRGDKVELYIRELTAQGDGWTRIGDSEFIVRRTLPGDRVEANRAQEERENLGGDCGPHNEHPDPPGSLRMP
jgi:tRNA/tmRNA/rRNA uracil-C5-methylase (TrmA/RlmC/RlmD family)